jgi:hypothetical protein
LTVAGGEIAPRRCCKRFAEEAAGTQDPAPDERYRAGVDPSRLLSLPAGNGSFCHKAVIPFPVRRSSRRVEAVYLLPSADW